MAGRRTHAAGTRAAAIAAVALGHLLLLNSGSSAACASLHVGGLWGVIACTAQPCDDAATRFEFHQVEMAVPIELVLYAADKATATSAAQSVFARFHQLDAILSDYAPQSELSRLSATSGGGQSICVSDDLWKILCVAQDVSRQSGGAFDVTIGPIVQLWRRARRQHEMPSPRRLSEAMAAVGYDKIRLTPEGQRVELLTKGMKLDLGGIAKGYAVAEAAEILRNHGITSFLIQAGGDIALGDSPPGQPGWRIGIAPLQAGQQPSQFLWLSRCAVASSGDAWQFAMVNGKRYSHVIDPRTGIGLTDRRTVTLVGQDSTLLDALSKAVAVLGPEKGFELVESHPGVAALLRQIADDQLRTFESSRWKTLPAAPPGEK